MTTRPYVNDKVADNLYGGDARKALKRIARILDGDPAQPGKEWSQDEIEAIAGVMTSYPLGFVVRSPGVRYDPDTLPGSSA